MYDGPLYLTGVYRSGKNLFAHMLGGHAKLRITNETLHFFRFYLSKYQPMGDRYPEIVKEAAIRLSQRWGISVPEKRIVQRLKSSSAPQMNEIYDAIMVETFCDGRRDIRWGEMSGLQWSNIPLFLQTFPGSQTILILRDPRDVLASFREYTYETPHRYMDAVFCCLHSMNWAATVGTSLPKDRFRVVRHEDVVSQPEATLRDVCQFLRIEYVPDMIDPAGFKDDNGQPWQAESPFGDVGRTITSSSVGRWRQNLQTFEVAFVESVLGDLLQDFGYEPSGATASMDDLKTLWHCVRTTPLLQSRMRHWMETGEGTESFPSDPTVPANWPEMVIQR